MTVAGERQPEPPPPPASGALGRTLGLPAATLVGIGAMMGAGIFVLSGAALRVSGPGAVLAFLLNGAVSLITASSFAELGTAFPESGGGYAFARRVFPIGGAFAAGWVLWSAYVVAAALYALGFASFLGYAVGAAGGPLALPRAFEVLVAVATTGGALRLLDRYGAGPGNAVTLGKLVAFLVLIGIGVAVLAGRPHGTVAAAFRDPFPFGFAGTLSAMGFTYIALEGFEVIATVGEEVKDPARTIPRAMFLSIALTLAVYLTLLVIALAVGGPADGSPAWRDLGGRGDQAIAVAARRFAGPFGAVLVVGAGLLSTFSALSASLLAASRVSFSMARDRALPRFLGTIGGRTGAPRAALHASGVLAVVVIAATGDVEVAGAAASLVFLLSFSLANASGLLVRKRAGALGGYRAPFYPALPLIGITVCLGLGLYQGAVVPKGLAVVLVWSAAGGVLYRVKLRGRAETVSARAEALDATLIKLRGREPLVLVPLANPDRADTLLAFARALAPPEVGRVLAVAVAVHGREEPAERGVEAYDRAQEAIRRAVVAACRLGQPFEGVVVLATDPAEAIARTCAERRPETVLLGMSRLDAAGGPTVLSQIVARARTDIVVLKAPPAWSPDGVERIVVPVGGEASHDALRARLLGMLLRTGQRSVTLLRVLPPGANPAAASGVLGRVAEDLGLPTSACAIEYAEDAAEAVIRRAAEAGLIVLGLGHNKEHRRLVSPLVQRIAGAVSCPIVAIARAVP